MLTAMLCTGAAAAVVADDGRLSATGAKNPRSDAPVDGAGAAAEWGAARARMRSSRPSDVLAWPLLGAVTGRFGDARGGRSHAGLDIPMPAGTPIEAAGSGRVILREFQAGYGKYTCVAHRSITTCYAHQSRFRTTLGARVRRGQVIGYVGDTGSSSVTHLHFEVRRGKRPWGTPLDPGKHLPRRG